MFHVSLLKQYIPDPSHILDDETIITADDGTFAIEPQEISQTRIRTLRIGRSKNILLSGQLIRLMILHGNEKSSKSS